MGTSIGLREDLIKLASRQEGVALHEVKHWSRIQMHEAFGSLREQGRVVHVGNRHDRRFFTDLWAAGVYKQKLMEQQAQKKKVIDARLAARRRAKRAAAAAAQPPKKVGRPRKVSDDATKAPKAEAKVKAPKPAKPKPVNNPKPSVKFGQPKAGVNIPKYTGPKFDKNQPADYSKAKFTVCPSPAAFGPAAKLLGLGQ